MLTEQNASRHSTLRSPEVAAVVIREHGAQALWWAQEEDGSNVDNQLANVTTASPKSLGFQLDSLRMEHQPGRFQACRSFTGHWCGTEDKLPLAIALVPDHLASYEAGRLSLKTHTGATSSQSRPAQPRNKRCVEALRDPHMSSHVTNQQHLTKCHRCQGAVRPFSCQDWGLIQPWNHDLG